LLKSRDSPVSASSTSARIARSVIGCDARVQTDVAEKTFRSLIFSAHRVPQIKGIKHMHNHTPTASPNDFFSRLLDFFHQLPHVHQQTALNDVLKAYDVLGKCLPLARSTSTNDGWQTVATKAHYQPIDLAA
jgi:hypothetical protein